MANLSDYNTIEQDGIISFKEQRNASYRKVMETKFEPKLEKFTDFYTPEESPTIPLMEIDGYESEE